MSQTLRCGIDTATIKSEGYSVRVAVDDGEVMFACKDVLGLCGYKAPGKVAVRALEDKEFPGTIKMIEYPYISAKGRRVMRAYFANKEATREMLHRSSATDEKREWLEEAVLTYNKPVDQPEPTAAEDAAPMQAPRTISGCDLDSLNRSIDRILVELVEIKKNMMNIA